MALSQSIIEACMKKIGCDNEKKKNFKQNKLDNEDEQKVERNCNCKKLFFLLDKYKNSKS